MYICTYVLHKDWQLRLSIFIGVDILIMISEFVVVAILSEWWLVQYNADHRGHIPDFIIDNSHEIVLYNLINFIRINRLKNSLHARGNLMLIE